MAKAKTPMSLGQIVEMKRRGGMPAAKKGGCGRKGK